MSISPGHASAPTGALHAPRIGRQKHGSFESLEGRHQDRYQPWPRQPLDRVEDGIGAVNRGFRRRSDRWRTGRKVEEFEGCSNRLARVDRREDSHAAALLPRPDSADVHRNLGLAWLELGRIAEAGEEFRQALRIKPEFQEARADLQRAQERMREGP